MSEEQTTQVDEIDASFDAAVEEAESENDEELIRLGIPADQVRGGSDLGNDSEVSGGDSSAESEDDNDEDSSPTSELDELREMVSSQQSQLAETAKELEKRMEQIANLNIAIRKERKKESTALQRIESRLSQLAPEPEDNEPSFNDDPLYHIDKLLSQRLGPVIDAQAENFDREESREIKAKQDAVEDEINNTSDFVKEDREKFLANNDLGVTEEHYEAAQSFIVERFSSAIKFTEDDISDDEVNQIIVRTVIAPMQLKAYREGKSLALMVWNKAKGMGMANPVESDVNNDLSESDAAKRVKRVSKRVSATRPTGSVSGGKGELGKSHKDLLSVDLDTYDEMVDEDPDIDDVLLHALGTPVSG